MELDHKPSGAVELRELEYNLKNWKRVWVLLVRRVRLVWIQSKELKGKMNIFSSNEFYVKGEYNLKNWKYSTRDNNYPFQQREWIQSKELKATNGAVIAPTPAVTGIQSKELKDTQIHH